MFEIKLLGTGGTYPLPDRNLTSLFVRFHGFGVLVDCGEGTQIAMRKHKVNFADIDIILLSHFHTDHMLGLPGLLLTMGNYGRTKPVTIYGPLEVDVIVRSLLITAPQLQFEINFEYLHQDEHIIQLDDVFSVTAFKGEHDIPCYGFTFNARRFRKFNLEKAKANNIPTNLWKILAREVEVEGYKPEQVLDDEVRKGLKLCYATDSRPTELLMKNSVNSDILILESMYVDDEHDKNAEINKHMTLKEILNIANNVKPEELVITHISPRLLKNHVLEKVKELDTNGYVNVQAIEDDYYEKDLEYKKR